MAHVSLRSISKMYLGGVLAVKEANLNVESREFLVIVGPSGCGKSTLLRMIAGLEETSSGEIWIGDKLVNDVAPKDRDIAMVFQNYALYPHMTVYDNMAFGLRLRGYGKQEIDQRVRDAAGILSIEPLLQRRPKELSGGERQRVAVGRAIVRKPLVFLFDEPLSNLDAKMRVQMRTEIHKLHLRLQTTMIYVTHDQTEAMTMGDRIVVMNKAIIQQVADPLTIYEHPANRFVASFIGSPPMNFIPGKIVRVGQDLYFTDGQFRLRVVDEMAARLLSYENKPVLFGVRPEDLYDKLFITDAPGDCVVTSTVELVEPLGAEVYLHLRVGQHAIIARVGPHDRPEVNQDIDLVFDMGKAHFFDTQTEAAIV
ncbi:MAG: glycerol-3-phosphate ABC transporter ATP-binding protein [Candidatus Omnitrophica bacterium CG11_big_fil_rev_8_21_14_0_20_63_9]|nr:MAG: glycerol-3-phosphate ABC transporter ATP-binding protein [Candidatus Omnitrophica bacterium CG11_big_fil_rev_8_21_14_0_20_63_9]